MLGKQVIVLGNVDVIETCDAEIKNDVEHEGEVEQRKIKPKILRMNCVLPAHINENDMERLDEQIQEKKKGKVGDKFFLHTELFPVIFLRTHNQQIHKNPNTPLLAHILW